MHSAGRDASEGLGDGSCAKRVAADKHSDGPDSKRSTGAEHAKPTAAVAPLPGPPTPQAPRPSRWEANPGVHLHVPRHQWPSTLPAPYANILAQPSPAAEQDLRAVLNRRRSGLPHTDSPGTWASAAAGSSSSSRDGGGAGRSSFVQPPPPPLPRPRFEDVASNPHLLQVIDNPNAHYESRTDIPFTRVLTPDAPRQKYRRRSNEAKSVIHWGQRKLLLSEIEFLTLYHGQYDTVVYAGAAPGTHTPYLQNLFPNVHFVLVDPAPFAPQLNGRAGITLRQEMFTDEVAAEYVGNSTKRVLFVSDVRSGDPTIMEHKQVESAVQADMERQMAWHMKIKPIASMLKFRLPYTAGTTKYLNGRIFLPVWGPITTSEGRLICETDEIIDWDHSDYEERMFHFNCHTRVGRYMHHVSGVPGLDYCYDCRAEVAILTNYITKCTDMQADAVGIPSAVAKMSLDINRALGSRTLAHPNSDPVRRREGITRRQFIEGRPPFLGPPGSSPQTDSDCRS